MTRRWNSPGRPSDSNSTQEMVRLFCFRFLGQNLLEKGVCLSSAQCIKYNIHSPSLFWGACVNTLHLDNDVPRTGLGKPKRVISFVGNWHGCMVGDHLFFLERPLEWKSCLTAQLCASFLFKCLFFFFHLSFPVSRYEMRYGTNIDEMYDNFTMQTLVTSSMIVVGNLSDNGRPGLQESVIVRVPQGGEKTFQFVNFQAQQRCGICNCRHRSKMGRGGGKNPKSVWLC